MRNTVDHVFEVEKKAFERLTAEERERVLYYGLKQIQVLEEVTNEFLQDKSFTLPSVITMIVASIYSVVDGLFVSNLVGAMAL